MTAAAAGIELDGLVKRYGDRGRWSTASRSQVGAGEIVALLGPNGAGKTTTVEIVEGYRRAATAGTVRVLGLDPATGGRALRARVGLMLQGGGIDMRARPRETLRQYAAFHADPRDPDELLRPRRARGGRADTRYRRLSGGERQRLGLALALVGRPEVVILDEPTAGMDPEGRAATRRIVADLRDDRGRDPPDQPRPRRRRAARRPDRDPGRRPDRRRGHARRARRGPRSAAAAAPRAPARRPPRSRRSATRVGRRQRRRRGGLVRDRRRRRRRPTLIAAIAAWAAADGPAGRRVALGRRLARGRLPRPGRRGMSARRVAGHGRPSARSSMEARLTSRRGENLLALIGIPVAVLLFFGSVDLVPVPAGGRRASTSCCRARSPSRSSRPASSTSGSRPPTSARTACSSGSAGRRSGGPG